MHNLPYNGRKPLVRSAAMRQIARFAAVFLASLTVAGAAFAQHPVYRVKDLPIDKVAPTAAEATSQGRTEARIVGAQRLIDRLTLPEDRASARQPIDPGVVARSYRGVTSQGEKSSSAAGGIRATGFVTWTYREDEVRKYLDSLGVPYVDSQAGLALIVPVAGAGVDARQWSAQWTVPGTGGTVTGKTDDSVLTPYIASTEAWPRRPAWAEIQEELTRTRANHGVIAEVYQQGAQYYVRLVDMRTNIPNPDIGVAGPFVSLQSAQAGAIAEMERAWKASSIVRGSSSTSLSLVAAFADIQEWTRIRKGLETSRFVRDLNIESVSTGGADITFAYAGRQDQLTADLRSKGVDLSGGNGAWVLRVAGPQ
jgi:hypothetical protein